jgi:hypothetical protein
MFSTPSRIVKCAICVVSAEAWVLPLQSLLVLATSGGAIRSPSDSRVAG